MFIIEKFLSLKGGTNQLRFGYAESPSIKLSKISVPLQHFSYNADLFNIRASWTDPASPQNTSINLFL